MQTNPKFSSEAQVLHTFLKHVPAGDIDTLVLQGSGIDRTRTSELFAGLDGVEVDEVPVKRLGQSRESALEMVPKVGAAARLLTYDAIRLVQAARRFKPHVVYSTQRVWDVRLARFLASSFGVPRVLHLHYIPGPWLGSGSVRALRSSHLVLCVSDYIRRETIKFADPTRLRVLHNAIELPAQQDRGQSRRDLSHELDLPAGAILVGMVARLNPSKCQVDLLKAMHPLLSSNPRLQLVFVGGDDLPGEPVMRALAALRMQLGATKQVHLLGQRPDVPRILTALDVFAHPSRQEPFCLSILEAMAHSLPVVAVREGGTVEQVGHGQTGLLTSPGDLDALTDALSRLVNEPELAGKMGRLGYERVAQEFNPVPQAERFLNLLNGVSQR